MTDRVAQWTAALRTLRRVAISPMGQSFGRKRGRGGGQMAGADGKRAWKHVFWAATLGALGLAGCASTRAVQASEPAFVPVAAARPGHLPQGEPFISKDLGFELDKPPGDSWALATNVTSPEGRSIPVVVAHPESGAQIVVQVSEPVETPEKLAKMLRDKLQAEKTLDLGQPGPLKVDSGGEAYGFDFRVKGEAKGRVAIIAVGEHIVLVVASWPENADQTIVKAVDGVVRSVRQSESTTPASMRPDKA